MSSGTILYGSDNYTLSYDAKGDYTLTRLSDAARVQFSGNLARTFERDSGFFDRTGRVIVFGDNFDWLASDYDSKMG